MIGRFGIVLTLSAWLLLGGGCDDAPAPPSSVNNPAGAETARSVPTTQELVEGARKDEKLGALPLIATVPQSWEVKTELADITFLKGHAPHGEVAIALADRPDYSETALQEMLNAARRDSAANPQDYLLADIREANGMTIMETQRIPKVAADPTLELPPGTPFEWTLRYFVKKQDKYDLYELNFFVLSKEQYDKDKDFLRKIIDSVRPAM